MRPSSARSAVRAVIPPARASTPRQVGLALSQRRAVLASTSQLVTSTTNPSLSFSRYTHSRASKSNEIRHGAPVELSFDVVQPTTPRTDDQTLVICHGLFGSKQNWRSLAKMFASRLGMPIYTLDLRNHGQSPHAEPHTYSAMAEDIAHFLDQQGLKSGVNLLGHSMGGKAVMAFALNEKLNKPLRSLISVDMTPAVGKMSPEFAAYTEAMMEVEKARVKTKHEADKILEKVEPVLATRQFLLTNARTTHGADPHLVFRNPLQLLSTSILHIGDFPYKPPPPVTPSSPEWKGPTLFLKGEHSRYINKHNIPTAKAFFPNMRLEVLDAGHWVHAERPKETVDLVKEFVEGVSK
ncbi:hypothetical protein CI109_100029 [Kwoniella shandongensis]|uniref:Uncharacterized protein n=1 Tax=Kwoniella shandongensis TaxID=1734106 RepID=A0A5M6BUH9_9TREE|nr:uncharacterized protein CI109_005998 [Kwoniella shandongensis]KAA5525690.1 hypothetical protein CI109_005998 [Kwoniella shandongensis]